MHQHSKLLEQANQNNNLAMESTCRYTFTHSITDTHLALAVTRKIGLPWFRIHVVVYNDPGRLISVHLMHSRLVAGWSGAMILWDWLWLFSSNRSIRNIQIYQVYQTLNE